MTSKITFTLPAKLVMTYDAVAAFKHLAESAKAYLTSLHSSSSEVPYARRLAIAAVAFAVQTAIEYGYEVEPLRAMERDLIDRLEKEA